MELKTTPLPRLAPWLVLLVVAFAAGRWSSLPPRSQQPFGENPSDATRPNPEPGSFASWPELLVAPGTETDFRVRAAAFVGRLDVATSP
jgi:hypothetical protein